MALGKLRSMIYVASVTTCKKQVSFLLNCLGNDAKQKQSFQPQTVATYITS
jgi:hypothetical protein